MGSPKRSAAKGAPHEGQALCEKCYMVMRSTMEAKTRGSISVKYMPEESKTNRNKECEY